MHFCFAGSQTCGCRYKNIRAAVAATLENGAGTMEVGTTSRFAALFLLAILLAGAMVVGRFEASGHINGGLDEAAAGQAVILLSNAGPSK